MNTSKSSTLSKKLVLGSIAGGILFAVLVFVLAPSTYAVASLAFLLGGLILAFGYYHLVYVLPRMAKDMETRVSMEALRASFWLVVFGLIIIVVGLLYLMNMLPPQIWRT